MKFRPSAIDEFLTTLPEDLQILALQVIRDEHGRFQHEDFTKEEKKMFRWASDFGASLAKKIEQIEQMALKYITTGST